MSTSVAFNRDFTVWSPDVKPWEKADDVGYVISEILWTYYPVGALMGAKISGNWLGEGETPANDPDDLDLMLRFRDPGGFDYVEIIIRSTSYAPFYAGYLIGGKVEITNDLVNGHRVLISSDGQYKYRYEFDGAQYTLVEVLTLGGETTNAAAAWREGTRRVGRARIAA